MARQPLSLNFKAINAELHASDATVDPLLTAAKITTIKVDGKDVAAHEAPLPARIAALGSLMNSGNQTEESANLIAANGNLAGQVEDLTNKLTSATSTIAAQSQRETELTNNLTVSQASVGTLTAKNAELTNLLDAGNKDNARLTGELLGFKTELAKDCLAAGCLALNVGADASESVKMEAAMKLSVNDLRNSYKGALNAAAARVGVSLNLIPTSAPTATGTAPAPLTRSAFEKLSPAAQTEFFKSKGKIVE